MPITVNLQAVMAQKQMTLTDLAQRVKIPPGQLKTLYAGEGQGIRFSTLSMVCKALECKPSDILLVVEGDEYQLLYEESDFKWDIEQNRERPKTFIGRVVRYISDL